MKPKICRFCGGEAVIVRNEKKGTCFLRCSNDNCCYDTLSHEHEEDAIAEWNEAWNMQLMEPWRDASVEVPCAGGVVLVIVSVKHRNVEMIDAYEIAEYDPEEEDWILEGWPEIKHPNVKWWMPLPEAPEGSNG